MTNEQKPIKYKKQNGTKRVSVMIDYPLEREKRKKTRYMAVNGKIFLSFST
jgi:hypothetical protein